MTAALIFLAWLTWTLGGSASQKDSQTGRIAWAFVAFEVVSLVLALRYFSILPAIMSGATAFALVMEAVATRREAA